MNFSDSQINSKSFQLQNLFLNRTIQVVLLVEMSCLYQWKICTTPIQHEVSKAFQFCSSDIVKLPVVSGRRESNVCLSWLQAFLTRVFPSYFVRKYSAWRRDGSFHYIHTTSFGNYSFICVDATLSPGPKRPYNFFGILNMVLYKSLHSILLAVLFLQWFVWRFGVFIIQKNCLKDLCSSIRVFTFLSYNACETFIQQNGFVTCVFQNQMAELSLMAAESLHSNHTIWFGHYPTSTIVSPSPGIRTLMR